MGIGIKNMLLVDRLSHNTSDRMKLFRGGIDVNFRDSGLPQYGKVVSFVLRRDLEYPHYGTQNFQYNDGRFRVFIFHFE